jgi:hypothetical protein
MELEAGEDRPEEAEEAMAEKEGFSGEGKGFSGYWRKMGTANCSGEFK